MRKKSSKAPASRAQFSSVFDDIFGMKAWQSRKNHRDKKSIPWQWALWGALAFFAIGFLMPTDSIWILLVAIAAAVIFYLARSTETVNEQVLLLTDDRSPSQKAAHKERTARAQKAQKAQTQATEPAPAHRRPGRPKGSTNKTKAEQSTNTSAKQTNTKAKAKAQTASTEAVAKATPARTPRKRGPRQQAKVLTSAAPEAQVLEAVANENAKAAVEAPAPAQVAEVTAPRRGRKPGSKNKPKTTTTPTTKARSQSSAPKRRPRKPRNEPSATQVTQPATTEATAAVPATEQTTATPQEPKA